MNRSFKVKEKERQIVFDNNSKETFRNVNSVDAKGGNWLRFTCDEGYVLVNPDKINYILVPKVAKVR